MDRKSRIKLLKRAIRATADHFGRKLTEDDLTKILEKVDTKGRPKKTGHTAEQIKRLERVRELLRQDPTLKRHPTYRAVAAEFPEHSKEATYDWLRRNYPKYEKESKSVAAEVLEYLKRAQHLVDAGMADAEQNAKLLEILDPDPLGMRKK